MSLDSTQLLPARSATGRGILVHIVRAFVDRDGSGGNPAGVVLDADDLADGDKQIIASRVGVSETAFISGSAIAAVKLDFFTPNRRIPHCGHATIATFTHLAAVGRIGEGPSSKETVDGPRCIEMIDGAAFMEQTAPRYCDPLGWAGASPQDVMDSLGLDASDAIAGPVVADTGNRFLFLGVRTGRILASIRPQLDRIEAVSQALDLIGYYVFTRDAAATECDATARMFAPRFAISEEAATGMAAGPLACVLHDRFQLPKRHWIFEQGSFMSPPSTSRLSVELRGTGDTIASVVVGGRGRFAETRWIAY